MDSHLNPLISKIKADKDRLKSKVHFIWLIGSFAKGTATPQSDTDLLIVQYEDNLEDWKAELRKTFPNIKLQTHQLLYKKWKKIKAKQSRFYQGVVEEKDHIEII
tara:strand:+ start:77 stop:391 length:315 start_codon:yes stop_codon:yes gene_type:complete